jgi:hypothetical protein
MTARRRAPAGRRRGGAASLPRVVSASYAAKNFGALVDAVREERAAYVVERAGLPVVEVVPAPRTRTTLAELAAAFRGPDRLSEDYLREVERGIDLFNGPTIPKSPWAS